jgi:large subunit ribosomal protein L19
MESDGMNINLATLAEVKPKDNIPELRPGDTVKVNIKIVEGDKERIQIFQGVLIRIRHSVAGTNITIRRVTSGVGVERTFPLNSPRVEKVEVLRHGKTRRAKLYYLRGLSAKASRIKERQGEREKQEAEKAGAAAVTVATPPEAKPEGEATA